MFLRRFLRCLFHGCTCPPGKPLPLSVTLLGEMTMLNYSAAFPPLTASDVVSREVTLTVGSDAPGVSTYPATEVSFPFSAPDNAVVTLSLVDIDDAGNRSEAAVTTFTATDTIPPPMPGALAVTLVSES